MGEILAIDPAEAKRDARSAFAKVHPDDLPGLQAAIARDFRDHRGLHWEGRVVSDGATRIVRVFSVRVEAQGSELAAHGVIEDVTDRRALERRLAESARLEAVGRLAGGVAHEFNNALLGILGTAELMAEVLPPGDPLRTDVEAIREAGARAAVLSKQLQAFGRQQTLRPAALQLAGLLEALEPRIRRAAGPGVTVVMELDHAPAVTADRSAVEGVVLELVANARAAMPGGGRLRVAAKAEEVQSGASASHGGLAPGRYGCIAVEDSGEPIDADALARIFEPFYSSTHMGRGTGLGLATIAGTVLQSHGWLEARQAPGGGTVFSVLLPGAVGEQPDEAMPHASAADEGDGPLTILLIDDEELARNGVARGLARLGHIVHQAARPQDALMLSDEVLAALDVLITDVLMPGMHGGTLAHRLRDRRPGLPVLFISGYTPDDTLRPHLEEPGTAFLAKPFTRDELLASVQALLAGRASS
jgi:two-component system cell cycle sensor histidine kinase/response regulator CckA